MLEYVGADAARPAVEFEVAACDLCGSDRERLIFEGADRLHHFPGTFRVVRCETCGWIRQNPRPTPDSIGVYYPTDYEPYIQAIDDEPNVVLRLARRYGMRKRCRAITRYAAGGTLLDVGCATGVFLNEMRRIGTWRVHGVELNSQASAYARERHGLDVRTGRLVETDFAPGSFDVITMWNVIEHLHSPVSDIRTVQRLLKDDGWFVFTIPNLESLEARWFGPAWIGWDLPRHLYLFPRQSLLKSLPSLGFEPVLLQCLSGSADAFALSVQLSLENRVTSSPRWARVAARALRSMPAKLAVAPFFWILNQAGLSTVITVFAQKRRPSGQSV